ncbi:MAG: SusD/RagB family nutrient-binding outer membrane lipoprotein [Chitinophagaceae bacterium]|nr:SusD/RagB family nutrient-binding outer membrane lipoprotein [Chitinophagaceae bacterium]
MKNIKRIILPLVSGALLVTGCNKFDEININPLLANEQQVQVEYFINGAMMTDQMDPNISERTFVLYWKNAAHQQWSGGGIATGGYNDDWSSQWYSSSYMGKALNRIYSAIDVANKQIESGNVKAYTSNLLQIARIYRAYLLSELTDNFGPIPLNGFQGYTPEFSSVKDVYYFMLDELKDAANSIDINVGDKPNTALDQAYGYNYAKWQKYANSMRLRLAMRLSEVDNAKAKSEFEDAATKPLILNADENFGVAERPGWDDLTGVMTRQWNYYQLPQTFNNIVTGLGGISSASQLDASFASYIKPADYVGLRFADHWPSKTNDPIATYWLDGLPNTIDPRAYKVFIIPGDFDNPEFNFYPSWDNSARETVRTLTDASGTVVKTLDAKFTWNGLVNGAWGDAGAKNNVARWNGCTPRLANHYRNSTAVRLFFANWETYFLLAEAATYNWAVPMTGKAAYEAGIDASFAYFGVSSFVDAYKNSTSYNMVGTSVSWDHTTEPGASHTMNYVDGYTGTAGTVSIAYPVNNIYKNGTVRNDHLTKIITQKYIAQNPWIPMEVWSDQRRLGLPFFENPAVETPLTNMPELNASNYMTSSPKFFPQRIKYPSGVSGTNPAGYDQALDQLGGPDKDNVMTPLWWAKH